MAKEKAKPIEPRTESVLRWPDGWARTPIGQRKSNRAWKGTDADYREAIARELTRLGVTSAVITLHADRERRRLDPGVAVWFSSEPADDFAWQAGLGLDDPAPTLDQIESAFRRLAQKHHPDAGGDVATFQRLREYRNRARAWVTGAATAQMDNCIPCDRFADVRENLAAIRMALAAFRQLERVGIPAILERVMDRAFKAQLTAAPPTAEGASNG